MALCSPGCIKPGSKAQLLYRHPLSLPEATYSQYFLAHVLYLACLYLNKNGPAAGLQSLLCMLQAQQPSV